MSRRRQVLVVFGVVSLVVAVLVAVTSLSTSVNGRTFECGSALAPTTPLDPAAEPDCDDARTTRWLIVGVLGVVGAGLVLAGIVRRSGARPSTDRGEPGS